MFFSVILPLTKSEIPLLQVRGNHEYYGIDTDGSYSLKAFEIYKNDEMKESFFVHTLKQKGIKRRTHRRTAPLH